MEIIYKRSEAAEISIDSEKSYKVTKLQVTRYNLQNKEVEK